jgi:hypothetical protein
MLLQQKSDGRGFAVFPKRTIANAGKMWENKSIV